MQILPARDRPETKLRYYLEKNGADLSEYPESTLELVYYPTDKIRVPVNKDNVLKSGLVKEKDSALIVDYIDIDLPGFVGPRVGQWEWRRRPAVMGHPSGEECI